MRDGMDGMEAGLAYGRALLLLAEVSEDRAINESVLAAVYLLGLYEVRYSYTFHFDDD